MLSTAQETRPSTAAVFRNVNIKANSDLASPPEEQRFAQVRVASATKQCKKMFLNSAIDSSHFKSYDARPKTATQPHSFFRAAGRDQKVRSNFFYDEDGGNLSSLNQDPAAKF